MNIVCSLRQREKYSHKHTEIIESNRAEIIQDELVISVYLWREDWKSEKGGFHISLHCSPFF